MLSKRQITTKLYTLFADTAKEIRRLLQQHPELFPEELINDAGKISRGENYRGLPYVILDYPRRFTQTDVLACRTMFWWGQHVSFTLQLQGYSLGRFRQSLINNYPTLNQPGVYVSVGHKPWEHHFDADNYTPIIEAAPNPEAWAALMQERTFVRLAAKAPLSELEQTPELALQWYKVFINALRP